MHTGGLQRDYGLLTTAVECTRKRHKNTKNLRELLFGEVLTSCVDSYQRAEAVMWSEKYDGQGSDFGGPCCADHMCSNWSRRLISGLISFRASHLISGRRCPSLYSQELISHSPPSSMLLCDGVSVTGCIAGLYALIMWHPPFRCAIKVPLLSSFLLCWQNNVQ